MSGNEFGKIFKRAWGDPDFKALTSSEQGLYFKLISQPDISLAGVLTLAPARWSGQTSGLTPAHVERDLKSLEASRYVLVDRDTQEVLVRSYIRNDLGWRSPRTMIGIANAVARVLSPVLRGAISRELLRLDVASLSTTINERTSRSTREVVEAAIRGVLDDSPPEPDTDSDTPSDGVSEGVSAVRALNCNCNSSSRSNSKRSSKRNESGDADAPPERPSIDDDFEAWYATYPRRGTRGRALTAYRAARKKADGATLLDASRAYAETVKATRTEERYIKLPASWLNGECWLDQAEPTHDDSWDRYRYDPDTLEGA